MAARSFADLAFVGARIRTLDPDRPAATAVAMRAGTIIAVGSDAEVRASCDGATEVIDLAGTALVPGLTDSHIHPFLGSDGALGADLTGVTTLEGVRDALRAERARCGDGSWVRGYALAYEAFPDGGIDGRLIEEAVGGNPALISFFDFHTALATPEALRRAGVDGPRTFTEASEVVCVAGAPTGELREPGAISLVMEAVPEPTDEERLLRYRTTFERMNAVGLTGAHVMIGSPQLYEVCREMDARGWMTVRCVVPLHQEPDIGDDEIAARLPLLGERGQMWRGGTAKFFIDGVVETGTAWLYEPDTNGGGTVPFWPTEERYASVVGRFARAGFACTTHAVGDRAVRAALDAYRAAGPVPGGMHRIEHIETLQDHDLPRFAAEHVCASMQPLHMENNQADQSDPWSRALGPERSGRAFRARDIWDTGALVCLGSDWPVARFDPRRGMGWCRLRREPGHPERGAYGPDQALTGLETLLGYTRNPAALAGEGAMSGCIREGYRADLTGFADDPVEVDADDLLELPVTVCVVAGAVRHRSDV
jgi:predicted amidohydrolase YtcJ